MERLWWQYFGDADGLLFVLDCTDKAEIARALWLLFTALQHPNMMVGCPFERTKWQGVI